MIETSRRRNSLELIRITVDASRSKGNKIDLSVRVTNLAGHKFPTGVNFRRAFLEVAILDEVDRQLWCSGCTDGNGVIVGPEGPLASEFARLPTELQPNHRVVSAADQVQVYESRHADCDGILTTSFLKLCDEAKDNRILPAGWSSRGPYADATMPVPPSRNVQPGSDTVRYTIELPEEQLPASYATVKLQFQALPPYYLVDRMALIAEVGPKPQTQRLFYLATHVNLDDPNINASAWKLQIGCRSIGLGNKSGGPCE